MGNVSERHHEQSLIPKAAGGCFGFDSSLAFGANDPRGAGGTAPHRRGIIRLNATAAIGADITLLNNGMRPHRQDRQQQAR